ncbi:MAG: hypothetical protein P1V97_24810 [Planctomycetota bacterium]|nr:hypothetical protein [Planctomycetota bacterium]
MNVLMVPVILFAAYCLCGFFFLIFLCFFALDRQPKMKRGMLESFDLMDLVVSRHPNGVNWTITGQVKNISQETFLSVLIGYRPPKLSNDFMETIQEMKPGSTHAFSIESLCEVPEDSVHKQTRVISAISYDS